MNPVFHFDKAKVILSLDCDFLGGEDDAHNHIRNFVAGPQGRGDGMSRLYVIESLFTLTGAKADHRLRVPPSLLEQIAEAISFSISNASNSRCLAMWIPSGLPNAPRIWPQIAGNALVVAGQRQPFEIHLLAHAINSALGAIGNTVTLVPVTENIRQMT